MELELRKFMLFILTHIGLE